MQPRTRMLFRRYVLLRNLDHGGLDGLKNLEISGAPAQDAGERRANLIASCMRMLIQQRFRGDQNRGRAVSALRRTEIGESVLQRMQSPFQTEAFDSQDIPGAALDSEDQAGEHGLVVQKDGASATFSQLTAVFRARMAEILAKDFEESFVWCKRDVYLLTVQRHSNVRCFLRRDRKCDHVPSPLGKSCGGYLLLHAGREEFADRAGQLSDRARAAESIGFGQQSTSQILREPFGDFSGSQSAIRVEPANAPVQGSKDRARGESWIAGHELAGAGAGDDELTHTLFVTIAFHDQGALQTRRQGAGQEMRRRAFDFVEDAAQMGDDYQAESLGGAGPQAAGLLEGREHAVEGNILAEEKNFVFPLEVVVKVGGREVGGGGDVAHAGFGKATDAELFSSGTQDFQAPCKITALNTGLVSGSDPFARQFGLLAARTTGIAKFTRRDWRCQQNTNTCSDNEQPFSAADGHFQNSQQFAENW